MAHMSSSFRGGFCPISLPLFHGSWDLTFSISDSFAVERSLILGSSSTRYSVHLANIRL
jgi:hypothetical protein